MKDAGTSFITVLLNDKASIFIGSSGNFSRDTQPISERVSSLFSWLILLGRLFRSPQFISNNLERDLMEPIDEGTFTIAVELIFNDTRFLLIIFGTVLRFRQPLKLRVLSPLVSIRSGKLPTCLQLLRLTSESLLRFCKICQGTSSKLVQFSRFIVSRFLAQDRSGICVRLTELLTSIPFNLSIFCSKKKWNK